jgi:tRNA-splicing ligase RtcB
LEQEADVKTVKTFGPVDERSLAQLERCMEAGDAAYGVLCADHHPGYSQPIGGGIAYEGYVSPSGVGYGGLDHPGSRLRKVWVEEQIKPGRFDWPAVQARLREQGIVLVGGGADEAPTSTSVYRTSWTPTPARCG